MEDVYQSLRELNIDVPVPLELPDEDQLVEIEEQILISLPHEYREFLLHVSDVIYGSIEPATVCDPQSHTYLPEIASNAWAEGVPRELIPVCQATECYYCITEEGEVKRWQDGFLDEEESWNTIWHWARDVWLTS